MRLHKVPAVCTPEGPQTAGVPEPALARVPARASRPALQESVDPHCRVSQPMKEANHADEDLSWTPRHPLTTESSIFAEREVVGMTQKQRDIKRKLAALEYAEDCGNVAKTCRHFGISRQCYYDWRRAYEQHGEAGLVNRGPCPESHSPRTPAEIEEKIVHLRLTYHLGPTRIACYLGRCQGFSISTHGVYNVLVRHGINRLPDGCHSRSMPSVRWEEKVSGPRWQ